LTCQEIAEFLMDYLNGDLAAEVRTRFEDHLAECPDCVGYLQTYEMTIRLGQSCRDPAARQAPEELIRAILAAQKGTT
jgi:predicted anti-sigma-YlaC factor YlaD